MVYESVIRINGRRILPPIIDEKRRAEVLHFKQLAMVKEQKMRQRCANKHSLLDHQVPQDNAISMTLSPKEVLGEQQLFMERRCSGYESSVELTPPLLLRPSKSATDFITDAATTPSMDVSQSTALDSYSIDDVSVITTTAVETPIADDHSRLTSGRSSDSGTVVESVVQLPIAIGVKSDITLIETNATTNAIKEINAVPNETHFTASVHERNVEPEHDFCKKSFDTNSDVLQEAEACCSVFEAMSSSAISKKLSKMLESFSQNVPQVQLQEKFGELTDVIETLHKCQELEKRDLQMRQETELVELSKQIEFLQLNLGGSNLKSSSHIPESLESSLREEHSNISEGLNETDLKKPQPKKLANESTAISQAEQVLRKQLPAFFRGHLLRQFLKTEKASAIIQTIKDCRKEIDALKDDKFESSQSDLLLQNRLETQLRSALAELHDITFEIPIAERMRMISRQRAIEKQIKRDLMKVNQRRLSTASLKSMERKKAKLDAPAAADTSLSDVKSITSRDEEFRTQDKQNFAKHRGNQTFTDSLLSTTKSSGTGWTPRLQSDGSLNLEITTNFERKTQPRSNTFKTTTAVSKPKPWRY